MLRALLIHTEESRCICHLKPSYHHPYIYIHTHQLFLPAGHSYTEKYMCFYVLHNQHTTCTYCFLLHINNICFYCGFYREMQVYVCVYLWMFMFICMCMRKCYGICSWMLQISVWLARGMRHLYTYIYIYVCVTRLVRDMRHVLYTCICVCVCITGMCHALHMCVYVCVSVCKSECHNSVTKTI